MKEAISKAMRDPLGPVRVLFATQAYGMGADAPNIRNIIHIGPPSTPEGKTIVLNYLVIMLPYWSLTSNNSDITYSLGYVT